MGEYREGHSSSRDYERRGYDPRPPLPTRSMMGGRIYVGKLPSDIREKEIDKVFGKFGKISEIALKGNYCFIQYENTRGAKDAVYEMNDRTAFGDRIQVEHARTPKEFGFKAPRGGGGYGGGYRGYSGGGGGGRGYGGGYGGGGYGYNRYDRYNDRGSSYRSRRSPPMRSDYRLAVTNLSTRCDGQDLKAVMEKAGEVVYSDAHRRRVGEGVVEFATRKDMERALKKLDGLEINGKPIKLDIEEVRKRRSSRSQSRSRTRSRSHSRSRSGSKEKEGSSRSGSAEHSEDEHSVKSKDGGKSDDEEFEEAERSVKRRKQEKGSESDSEHDYDVVDDHEASDKEGAEETGSPSTKENDGDAQDGDEPKSGEEEENNADEDEDLEEVEEIVEEIVEEEVEVDDDDSQSNDECAEGENDDEQQGIEVASSTLLNGENEVDY